MKNKLGLEEVSSGKLVGELPVDQVDKTRVRRESVAPKIVVYPPMEELSSNSARGGSLLRALGRHLSRRSTDDDSLGNCSSNSDSGESESSCSSLRHGRSVSDSGSDDSERRRRHRSTVSLRRVLQSLSLSGRSHSCSSTERARQPKKNSQPKRILRPPVTYTYVRGLSGLPTQRVPRNPAYCTSSGLHR